MLNRRLCPSHAWVQIFISSEMQGDENLKSGEARPETEQKEIN